MTTKQEVFDLTKKHPDWTAREIADELNCSVQYLSACKRRYGVTFAEAKRQIHNPNNVFALGREARRAGLTVEKIRQLAAT